VAEKTEAATARSHDERELAHERGKAKVAAGQGDPPRGGHGAPPPQARAQARRRSLM
uniref:Uncharacterized protein n=1 Tax=Aegilops tauschii subsp. strangulata TaxID=200361 RepID=A0A453QIU1_AEGTS